MNKYGKNTSYYEKYHKLDIVSRYNEPIDEEKLNEFSCKVANKMVDDLRFNKSTSTSYNFDGIEIEDWENLVEEAIKVGYRKAKGE